MNSNVCVCVCANALKTIEVLFSTFFLVCMHAALVSTTLLSISSSYIFKIEISCFNGLYNEEKEITKMCVRFWMCVCMQIVRRKGICFLPLTKNFRCVCNSFCPFYVNSMLFFLLSLLFISVCFICSSRLQSGYFCLFNDLLCIPYSYSGDDRNVRAMVTFFSSTCFSWDAWAHTHIFFIFALFYIRHLFWRRGPFLAFSQHFYGSGISRLDALLPCFAYQLF